MRQEALVVCRRNNTKSIKPQCPSNLTYLTPLNKIISRSFDVTPGGYNLLKSEYIKIIVIPQKPPHLLRYYTTCLNTYHLPSFLTIFWPTCSVLRFNNIAIFVCVARRLLQF
jgi:hypothetical protein